MRKERQMVSRLKLKAARDAAKIGRRKQARKSAVKQIEDNVIPITPDVKVPTMMTGVFSPANFPSKPKSNKDVHRGLSVGGGAAIDVIMGLPAASQGEFEMTDHEIKLLRRRIYDINKTHPRGLRFKTMREGRLLLVWRIR